MRHSGQRSRLRRPIIPCLLAAGMMGLAAQAQARISLGTAINLALQNSPKVKLAQADVRRAQAALAESRDAFVPAIVASGGVGKSTGAPLNPPVIFSIAAQSLVFNSSQMDYIRAARAGVASAQAALDAVRSDTAEDVANTYLALDSARQRRAIQAEALADVHQLVVVTQERFTAGVDPHMEVTKSRHTEEQIRLQQLLLDDDIAFEADHLARLTGLTARSLTTDRASVPSLPPPELPGEETAPQDEDRQNVGLSAAFAAASAKQYTAHGEKRYLLRPQVAFNASYSRISTAFTTYTQYYPGFGAANNSFNSLNFGVEITLPILDMVHRARAHEAAADAAHSLFEAQAQQMQFLEGRAKLRHSTAELAARRNLAQLDQDLAQDQLDTVLLRLQANAATMQGEPMTPKDEKNARLQERLRKLDALSAELQLEQADITLMRQEGTLANWLTGAATSPGEPSSPGYISTPAGASPSPSLPATVGSQPAASSPAQSSVPVAPAVGSPPASLPAGPVTEPGATTPATPPGSPHP